MQLFFYLPTFCLRAFAFLIYLDIFNVPLFLLSALRFSRTLLIFILLHTVRCLIFTSQISNEGKKEDINWVFIFPDPYMGH